MNKNMKKICRDISQGENLEMNIPKLFNNLATMYEKYAEIKFTMHYYTFYESFIESKSEKSSEQLELLQELNTIIKESILTKYSTKDIECNVKRLDAVRNNIIQHMKILTAFTDIFSIYEYILNRIEPKFIDKPFAMNEEEFIANVVRYIFDTKDNVVINDKIKEVIGQLPIRLTKRKYFDLLLDSLSIYKGGEATALDSYVYMIKTSSMLYNVKGMDSIYPNLYELQSEYRNLDYRNLTLEDYNKYSKLLVDTAAMIQDKVDFYYGMQEIANHLYVMLITAPYAFMEGGYRLESLEGEMKFLLYPPEHGENVIKSINAEINKNFLSEVKQNLSKDVEDKLFYTEGIQETLFNEFGVLEAVLFDIKNNYKSLVESLMLEPFYNCLSTAQNLLGSSLFIELDNMVDDKIVDDAYLTHIKDSLVSELTELFDNTSKYVIRAIMANTINKMPVFFQSVNEVMDYIKNSLELCHDEAEKTACISLINTFLEN